jgi:glycosyltransferase involved in cell wall biosynthesis
MFTHGGDTWLQPETNHCGCARQRNPVGMRITFVIPDDNLSGGIKVVAIYAAALRQHGHDVLVVGNQRGPRPMSRIDRLRFRFGTVQDIPDAGSHFEGGGVDIRLFPAARRLNSRDLPDADVVIATWWTTAEFVLTLSPAKGRKFHLVQGHDTHPPHALDRIRATLRSPVQKIVVSQWLRRLMADQYGDQTAILVPNGVDCGHFRSAVPRRKADKPTVGFVYSPVHGKGCDTALEAIALARSRFPDMVVKAFGRQPLPDELARDLSIRYAYRPSQAEIVDIYSACDVWLFPSREEGFGLPLLEATACGTPLVATPAGAAPEIIAEGTGVLVAPADPQAMAEAIQRVLSMPEDDWRELSARCVRAAHVHAWPKSAELFEQVLVSHVMGKGTA